MKIYVVGTHYKCLSKPLLMSTHNICFHGEISKILCGYPLFSGAMIPEYLSLGEPVCLPRFPLNSAIIINLLALPMV